MFLIALSLAASGGGVATFAQTDRNAPIVELNYMALGEMAARYCEVFKCHVDLPPPAMSYPIIVPYYNSENKTYLEAQLRAFGAEKNYSCNITLAKISCIEKKNTLPIIDSTNNIWNVLNVNREELELAKKIIVHNKNYNDSINTPDIDTSLFARKYISSSRLYMIKVLIRITEFDIGYRRIKASYVSDFYLSDFSDGFLKYGNTIKEMETSQVAENGTMTNAYRDKLQGLQIQNNTITITANNRDLEVNLFGGSQELLQVRKECGINLFGFELFCGLIQTSILISLE